jgi:hypothetical protein
VHITLWLLWKNSTKPAFYADFYPVRIAKPRKIEVFRACGSQTVHLSDSSSSRECGVNGVRPVFFKNSSATLSVIIFLTRRFLQVTCTICEKRKEKRFCPAVHGRICPQCCGEQREVTLDCPSDCAYLQQAREHEKPRPMAELDRSALFLQIEVGDQFIYEQEHLIMGLTYAMAKSARADRALKDTDLIAALTAMTKSYETLANSGLHYESPIPNMSQQAVASEVQKMIREYREAEQKHLGYTRLRDSDVLRALVFVLRMAHGRTSGRPKSRAFVDFLSSQFPEKHSAVLTPQEATSSIIVP